MRGDPVLLLSKRPAREKDGLDSVWQVADDLCREAAVSDNPDELTAQRLYSRLVAHYLVHNQRVPLDAMAFYEWFTMRYGVEAGEHAGR